jgi:hypothetical protein
MASAMMPPGCSGHYLPSPAMRVKAAAWRKARRGWVKVASKKSGDDFRHEENYKQGIAALGGAVRP